MLSLPGFTSRAHEQSALVVPGMFDSETVAFVSGECDASSIKVAFFHRSTSAPAASCAEIVLFPQFQACVIAGKTRNRNVLLRAPQKKTLTREARYDLSFPLQMPAKINRNAPKARYDCAPCFCKMLSVLFCVFRCGAPARRAFLNTFSFTASTVWLASVANTTLKNRFA